MTVLYLEVLAAMAVSPSVLMAGAWMVRQRSGNSGRVDTIWTFSLGFAPVCVTGSPPLEAQMLRWRGERHRDDQSRTSQFCPLPPHA